MNDPADKMPPAVRPEGVLPDAILRVFRVPPESAGMRVDRFLASQLRNTSRTRAKDIAERTAFSLQGRPLKPSERLRAEEHVVLWRPPFEERDEKRPIVVVHEDPHLLVVDKPPNVAVHPTARHHHSTIMKRLDVERPGEFFALIHRIDRETSGLLMVARSAAADRAFKRALEDRSLSAMSGASPIGLHKTYLAITWGTPPTGLIDMPLEPDTDNPLRVKMRVAETGSGLEAKTKVRLLDQRRGYSLVECELLTGRQHQIRVHLAAHGTPIVGDKLYGPDERMLARAADGELTEADLARLELPRHALHAHRYRLTHAITGEALELSSPLPQDLDRFWRTRPGAHD